jgi:tetrahydromethanopterin S-methyltransferase subunit B
LRNDIVLPTFHERPEDVYPTMGSRRDAIIGFILGSGLGFFALFAVSYSMLNIDFTWKC